MSPQMPHHMSLASPRALTVARALTLGAVALVFPAAQLAVFAFDQNRIATADIVAATYSFGLFAAFTTAFWPLPSLRAWSRRQRIQSAAVLFMIVSYATHLSWELVWLLFHDSIAAAKDSVWAYPWWAYIDGGDTRYATAPPELVMMEVLSVANGIVGAIGLRWWFRSGKSETKAVLLCMATAVVHLYSVALYYGSEIAAGMPNVGESAFDIWIKFGLANAPWAVMPWVVLAWGAAQLGPAPLQPPDPV